MTDPNKKTIDVDEKDLITEMREQDREFQDAMGEANKKAIDDLKMLLGEEQWDPEVKKIRESLKRPMITQNLLPQFNKNVKNEQRQSRPQVKAIPVDDAGDADTANIIAGLLRNIWYQSQADAVRDMAFDTVVDCGRGAWRILPEYASPMSFDQELRIQAIDNPLAVSWDLACKKFDTSDKQWCHVEDVIPKKRFERMYPGKKTASVDSMGEGTQEAVWFSQDGVRVVERWWIEKKKNTLLRFSDGSERLKAGNDDEWVRRMLASIGFGARVVAERPTEIPSIRSVICSGAEILEGPFEMPGQYIPIMIAFGEIMNIQGKKHYKSLHRDAKQTQQLHNYLITSLIEAFALQPNVPYIGTAAMFADHLDEWAAANIGGKPYLPYTPDPSAPGARPERQMPPQVSNALPMMIDMNMRNMRAVYGMYESDLGMKSNEKSGVAIARRQAQGDTGTFVFVSNFDYVRQFEGRCCVDLIPHYYDAPRAAMITGMEGEHSRVMLNQAVPGPNGKPLLYDLKAGKYDVIITTGPAFASQRQENMQAMVELMQPLMQTNPNAGSVLLLEIVRLMDVQNRERLEKLVKATLPPELQAIIDAENPGSEGEDPQVLLLQQQFDAKMQEVMAQLQELGATNEQLAQANEAGKLQMQEKELEIQALRNDVEMAKREMQVEAKEAEIMGGEAQLKSLIREFGQLKATVESMDSALAEDIKQRPETMPMAGQPVGGHEAGKGNGKMMVKEAASLLTELASNEEQVAGAVAQVSGAVEKMTDALRLLAAPRVAKKMPDGSFKAEIMPQASE